MGRVSRILIEHACYHVVARGNQKQEVFKDEEDYWRYLSIVRKAKRKYGVSLYSYCLMPNHVHLLIELEKVRALSKFMHWINRGYTAYFNNKYHAVGHLWQGRFKSKPIVKGEYLTSCANYIEGNPMRAGLAHDIAAYAWSSFRERCLSSKKVDLDEMLLDNEVALGTG